METNGKTIWPESPAGKQIQARLADDKTLDGLDRLLSRIDTLEKAVDNLTILLEKGPGMVSMVTDMADEAYKNAADSGVNIEQRLGNALTIAEKLTAPAMVEKLEGLLQLADQAPGLVAMTTDAVDETFKRAADNGVDINQRLGSALEIAEKLTAPEMVEKLNALLKLSDQAPGLVSMAIDGFDEQMGKLNQKGLDIQCLMELGQTTGVAIAKANCMPETKVGGFFSMMRAMKDPDRQRAIGFLMNIAKAYGQQMNLKNQ